MHDIDSAFIYKKMREVAYFLGGVPGVVGAPVAGENFQSSVGGRRGGACLDDEVADSGKGAGGVVDVVEIGNGRPIARMVGGGPDVDLQGR